MIDRRKITMAALAGITTAALPRTVAAQPAMSRITAYGFSFPALAGGDIKLADFAGHPFLVVNTASQCGNTPQYAGLQQLWTEFHDRGLMMIMRAIERFRRTEPRPRRDRRDRATRIRRHLPMAPRLGEAQHPPYADAGRPGMCRTELRKYLIGRDGYLADSFAEALSPRYPYQDRARPRAGGGLTGRISGHLVHCTRQIGIGDKTFAVAAEAR